FGEIPQDEDDLVFHVKAGVAVVAEILTFRDNDAVASEHDASFDIAVVGKGKGADHAGLWSAPVDFDRRTAVARARGELERKERIGLPWQRLRADLLKLRCDVVACQPLAGRSCEPAFEALRRKRLHMRARSARGLLRDCVTDGVADLTA